MKGAKHTNHRSQYRHVCGYASALLLLWAPLAQSAETQEAAAASRIHVGFGSTINDAEVRALLDQRPVTASAVFMWSAGLTGTFRSKKNVSPEALLQQARADAVKLFTKALATNKERTRAFLNEHSEPEVTASEALQAQARSLLNTRGQLETALAGASSGRPLVFGMDVSGDDRSLELLRRERAVKSFYRMSSAGGAVNPAATSKADRTAAQQAIKPAAYQAEYRNPAVETVSARDLYRLLQDAAATDAPLDQLVSGR